MKNKKVRILNHALKEKGWRVVFMLRLVPVPYSMMCYLLGTTSVSVKNYLIGSTGIFCFPLLYCYSGVCLRELASFEDMEHPNARSHAIGLMCVELFLAIGVGSYIAYKAKLEL